MTSSSNEISWCTITYRWQAMRNAFIKSICWNFRDLHGGVEAEETIISFKLHWINVLWLCVLQTKRWKRLQLNAFVIKCKHLHCLLRPILIWTEKAVISMTPMTSLVLWSYSESPFAIGRSLIRTFLLKYYRSIGSNVLTPSIHICLDICKIYWI